MGWSMPDDERFTVAGSGHDRRIDLPDDAVVAEQSIALSFDVVKLDFEVAACAGCLPLAHMSR